MLIVLASGVKKSKFKSRKGVLVVFFLGVISVIYRYRLGMFRFVPHCHRSRGVVHACTSFHTKLLGASFMQFSACVTQSG